MKKIFTLILSFITIAAYSQWTEIYTTTNTMSIGLCSFDTTIVIGVDNQNNLKKLTSIGFVERGLEAGGRVYSGWKFSAYTISNDTAVLLASNNYGTYAFRQVKDPNYVNLYDLMRIDAPGYFQPNMTYKVSSTIQTGNRILVGSDQGIYKSEDKGQTWTLSSTGITNLKTAKIIKLGNKILAIGKKPDFDFNATDKIYVSTNNGDSWTENSETGLLAGMPDQFKSYNDIVVCKNSQNADVVILATMFGLYRSTDGGNTWSASSTVSVSASTINSLAVNGSDLYLTISNGLYKSTDAGINWTAENTGSYVNVDKVAVNNGFLYAGFYTDALEYHLMKKPVQKYSTGIDEVKSIHSFQLENFPNPLKNTTTFRYHIETSGMVKIEIYDVLGHKVNEPVNEYQSAGNYSYTFDATHLNSGIYYYRIANNGKSATNSMIIAK